MDSNTSPLMTRGAFWLMLRQVAVWAACVDGLYLVVFLLLDMPVVALLNIVSACAYGVAYWLLTKRINRPAVLLMWTEVLVHAGACTVMLGWDSGIHYFLLVFLPAVAVSRSYTLTIGALAFLLLAYMSLDALTQVVPVFHVLDTQLLTALRWLNVTVVFVMFAWIARHYVRLVQEAEARLREMATTIERERIARELHDTILQDVHALVLRFQTAMQKLPPHEPARAIMETALEHADRVLVEGRDRLSGLRSLDGTGQDVCEALTAAGVQFSAQYGVSFELRHSERKRELQELAADEVYRIGREALLNAFQHARAGRIRVEVHYGTDSFRLQVRDDGIGIDLQRLGTVECEQRWGLVGMKERARRLGAGLSVARDDGGGTRIDLRVPASRAYRAAPPAPPATPDLAPVDARLSMECER